MSSAFPREVLGDMRQWASKSARKPLIVRGARQVGKTWAVRLFGTEFDRYIELNLEKAADAALFESRLAAKDMVQAILLAKGVRGPVPFERTLLFVDEIQQSPRAVASLRGLYEEMPELNVIAAGSLLEAMLVPGRTTFPVGRVEYLFMRPLGFREFLVACDQRQAVDALDTVPLPEYAVPALLDLFHRYALVGGMPEAVADYRTHGEIVRLAPIYRNLLVGYLDDVTKYARNETMKAVIRHCIETAPFEAGKRITFGRFGRSSYRTREAGEALRLIEKAMLIALLYPSTSLSIPIQPDFKKKPRLQFLDTGLLNHFVGLQGQYFAHDDLHSFYRGVLAEHIVGQEFLLRSDNVLKKLCFWVREKSQSKAEVDFLIQHGGRLVPVEVKAGKTGRLRSLHQFINASGARWAVRLQAGSLGIDRTKTPEGRPYRLLNLPYFLAGKLSDYLHWATGI